MNKLENDTFLRALLKQPVERTPIWVMRQAGRYLPEYRETRQRAGDFMSLCRSPDFCTEVTLQPLERFDLDAAILFSDILTIPDAMGLELSFTAGEGPRFAKPIKTIEDINRLGIPDPEAELSYVPNAVRQIKSALNNKIPLIGFAGSPWTLACYMLEGGNVTKDFRLARAWCYHNPDALHQLLNLLSDAVVLYLQAQINAGVDCIMLFDTWGGLLTPQGYQDFSLSYMQKIIKKLNHPSILFTKQGGNWLESMAATGVNGLGIDWHQNLNQARQRVGDQVALQGNLDPAILLSHPGAIEQGVADTLASYGSGPGHIFNLGHGITPDVPPEHMAVLVDAVHNLSRPYHE